MRARIAHRRAESTIMSRYGDQGTQLSPVDLARWMHVIVVVVTFFSIVHRLDAAGVSITFFYREYLSW